MGSPDVPRTLTTERDRGLGRNRPWHGGLSAPPPLFEFAVAAFSLADLIDVAVDERPVEVGITDPEQLVAYRFGQAQFAAWLDKIGPERADEFRQQAAEAIRPITEPYRPIVVFLTARRSA